MLAPGIMTEARKMDEASSRGVEPELLAKLRALSAVVETPAEPARAPRRWPGVLLWLGSNACWAAIAAMIGVIYLASDIPNPEDLRAHNAPARITFLDVHGRQIARRGYGANEDARLDDLPPHLINAVLAIEDRRFYRHGGVDIAGVARAAWANVRAGRVVQGGSTITQQLAKNLFLDNERTFRRKGQEAILALWLEHRFTKDEILELYLNRVYLGGGAWGVEAAAQRYFGVSASDVNLAEAALLAGLLKAPSRYSPTRDGDGAWARALVVLDVMEETGAITELERERAAAAPVRVRETEVDAFAGHFFDWLAPQARALAAAGGDDLIVETTLDRRMQAAAEAAVARYINLDSSLVGAREAALIALDGDGAVRAMVGGRDWRESQFNRAVQARRQPGSAFKPFVYAAAFEWGLSPWDVREDAPLQIGDWEPRNYSEDFRGDIALMTALSRSINTVAVRVAEEIGRDRVVRFAQRMGVESPMSATRSLALGAHEVTLAELTSAYAPFANGGYRAPAYGLVRISTANGDVVWERAAPEPERVLDARPRRMITEMLARVVEEGTGRAAALPGREAAGKTGTTNAFHDAWFIGFVPGYAAGVWVGDDAFEPMDEVVGGGLPARVWRDFMTAALDGAPVRSLDRLPRDPDVIEERSRDDRRALEDLLAMLEARRETRGSP